MENPFKVSVLDHGFVVLRNISGPTRRDSQVVIDGLGHYVEHRPFDADDVDAPNSARMSFDQTDSERTFDQDMKLASYLMKNKHTSPLRDDRGLV